MKAHLIFMLVFLSFLFVPFVHSQTPTVGADLSATMKVIPEIGKDQPIQLTYTITNNSTKKVYVLRWGTPLEGFMSNMIDVRPAGGKPIDYDGFLASRVGPLPEDYVEIDAGKSLTVELPLHEGYRIRDKGDYTITLPRKMVLDVVHKKPAAGEVIKRKFVPTTVKMAQKDVPFIQKEPRSLQKIHPGQKEQSPGNNTRPQPGSPASPAPGINPPQHPGTPTSPAPDLNAPGGFRLMNEAPYSPYRYGLGSEFIRYANYHPNEQYVPLPPCTDNDPPEKCDIQSRLKIEDPGQRNKIRDAYSKAYGIAAESKVIMNAGDSVVGKTERFAKWFGSYNQVRKEDKPPFCTEWTNKFGSDMQAFSDRFDSVRWTFGSIYNRFFDTSPERLVRFFRGRNSPMGAKSDDSEKYQEAVKQVWPCDYRSVVAYVYTGETRPIIYLCDSFFDPPGGFQIDQAGVVIHELSHLANTGYVDDWAYEPDECSAVAQCVPDEAPKNADNYHLFASNPTGLRLGLEPGHWYAHFRTASGYYLSAGAEGTLNVTNQDSSRCSNCTFVVKTIEPGATADPLKDNQAVRLLTNDKREAVSASGEIVSPQTEAQRSAGNFQITKVCCGTTGTITTGDDVSFVLDGKIMRVTNRDGQPEEVFTIELAR